MEKIQSGVLALLRMELHAENIIPGDRGDNRGAGELESCRDVPRILADKVVTVYVIKTLPVDSRWKHR